MLPVRDAVAAPSGSVRLVSATSAAPVGTARGAGVQPGGVVRTGGGQCTLNFLFTGSDGHRYIGTAGHCILDEGVLTFGPGPGRRIETTWGQGAGPEARDADGQRIGEFAYAVVENPKNDIALIRLDDAVTASAEMAFFGGPTGTNNDTGWDPVILQYYGNGVGVDSIVPARTAVAPSLPSSDRVHAVGLAFPGDSGSPVISDDGRAVGVLVHGGVYVGEASIRTGREGGAGIDAGIVGITRLGPQLARADELLRLRLDLQVAPLH